MISGGSDRLQMAQEACLNGDILTSFEGFCTTAIQYLSFNVRFLILQTIPEITNKRETERHTLLTVKY